MQKMIISLIIEGTENDVHTIKGNILRTASEALVSCSANLLKERQEVKTDLIFNDDNIDPYEIRKL